MQTVSTSPLVRKYTLEEFWALPEPQDGAKLELIAGVLYMSPPPDFSHSISAAKQTHLFIAHLIEIGDKGLMLLPRAALWTGPDTYVEPDLFYLSEKTLKEIDPKRPDRADLVVEIISPSTAIYDRNTKADTYAALGVRELWLVDLANQTVEVRNLKRGQRVYDKGQVFQRNERVQSKVLPKFHPSVNDICQALPRKTK